MKTDKSVEKQSQKASLDLAYEPARDVDALKLIGNANLALHHHMAPAEGAFDLDGNDSE